MNVKVSEKQEKKECKYIVKLKLFEYWLLIVLVKTIKSYSWQFTRNIPLEIYLHPQIYYNHDRSQCLQLLRWLLTKCTYFEVKLLSCFT